MESIVVVGAGCFGTWTAWHLAAAGRRVTLVDAFGPGDPRSSSGGETRIIRMGYGSREIYTRWSMRALARWKAISARAERPLFHRTGFLWMAREEDPLSAATRATLERAGVPFECIERAELASRWPQIELGSVTWAMLEPESGVLMARRAVHAVAAEAERAGVTLRTDTIASPEGKRRLESVTTRGGERIDADGFVFACGPWLPRLFPSLLGTRIFVTRQEVLYFAPPPGDDRFAAPQLPAWIDFGREIYGIPGIDARGFKIAIDRHGPRFDPDSGDRVAVHTLPEVRRLMAETFPAMADAPLLDAEICQYENTSNGDLLIDRHPELENVWLVGGGSGHGFKHGPVAGEEVARLVIDGGDSEDRFRISSKGSIQERAVY